MIWLTALLIRLVNVSGYTFYLRLSRLSLCCKYVSTVVTRASKVRFVWRSFSIYSRYDKVFHSLERHSKYRRICSFPNSMNASHLQPVLHSLPPRLPQPSCWPLATNRSLISDMEWIHNMISKITPCIISTMKTVTQHSVRTFPVTCGRLFQSETVFSANLLQTSCSTVTSSSHTPEFETNSAVEDVFGRCCNHLMPASPSLQRTIIQNNLHQLPHKLARRE